MWHGEELSPAKWVWYTGNDPETLADQYFSVRYRVLLTLRTQRKFRVSNFVKASAGASCSVHPPETQMNDKTCFPSVWRPGNFSFVPHCQTGFNLALPGRRRLSLCCDKAGLQKSLLSAWLSDCRYYSDAGVPGEIHPSEAAAPLLPTSSLFFFSSLWLQMSSSPPVLLLTAAVQPQPETVSAVFSCLEVTRCRSIIGCEAHSEVLDDVVML